MNEWHVIFPCLLLPLLGTVHLVIQWLATRLNWVTEWKPIRLVAQT